MKIIRKDENMFTLPTGANIDGKNAVYISIDNYKTKNEKWSHHKMCIGSSKGAKEGMFYANENYYKREGIEPHLEGRKKKRDELSLFPRIITLCAEKMYPLIDILERIFDEEEVYLILDSSSYTVSEESLTSQHFPSWTKRNATFTSLYHTDSSVNKKLKEITKSQINAFLSLWAKKVLEKEKEVYIYYDSTNINSSSPGISIVEKGHPKDDKEQECVNYEVVINSKNNIPLSYKMYPGSIVDLKECKEMISFLKGIKRENGEDDEINITLIADRGYISEENIDEMDKSNISFLLMLKRNSKVYERILSHKGEVKYKSECQFHSCESKYGAVYKDKFSPLDKTERYFSLIFSEDLFSKNKKAMDEKIKRMEECLQKDIDEKRRYSSSGLEKYKRFFILDTEEDNTIKEKTRGRGKEKVEKDAFVITSFKRDYKKIDKELECLGFNIFVSSREMKAEDMSLLYSSRDSIEKTFGMMKSHEGADKFGVQGDESLEARGFVLFVSTILRSVLSYSLRELRKTDRKTFTVPSSINELEDIVVDRNIYTSKYEKRYVLTNEQEKILKANNITTKEIYEEIDKVNSTEYD